MIAKPIKEYLNGAGNLVQRGGEAEVNIAFKPPLNIRFFSYFESSGHFLAEGLNSLPN
jgi:hypothetical protein